MKREEIIESIKKIEKISNELIQTKEKIKDEELEKYFCKLEKVRMDMYDAAEIKIKFLYFYLISSYIKIFQYIQLNYEV